jgi:hypothetical protein
MTKRNTSADKELAAIGAILSALEKLDGESIQRVLDYVFGRLSLGERTPVTSTAPVSHAQAREADVELSGRRPSIRDLKNEKQPESSNQMAALVAYYLSEIAPREERKESINTTDLEKYFKQAAFRLPKSLAKTLSNAAAAGYLDAVGNGYYKLNAVGYNLVVHGLPRAHATPKSARGGKKRSRKPRS